MTAPDMENPPLIDFGEEHGDTKVKDLMADEEVELPTNISYFGSQYNKLYVSHNCSLLRLDLWHPILLLVPGV